MALVMAMLRVSQSIGRTSSVPASLTAPRALTSWRTMNPVAGSVLVETGCVDDRVEATAEGEAEVAGAGELFPAVPEQRCYLVIGDRRTRASGR